MADAPATGVPAPGGGAPGLSHVPNPWALTEAERNALDVVAKVYEVAASKKALEHLPKWMKKYRASKKEFRNFEERLDVTPDEDSNADVVIQRRREVLLAALAPEDSERGGEIDPERVDPKAPWRVRQIYEDAHDVAVAVIQRLANEWMRRTLRQALSDQAKLLLTANEKRNALQFAARFVEERVAAQVVSRRDADLDRVIYTKNRRWFRDGDTLERIFRVKYILAMRKALAEAEESIANRSSTQGRAQETRGLRPAELNRATNRASSPAPLPADPALLGALQFLARLKWHPNFGTMVKAWKNAWQTGFRELAENVNDSFKSNSRLTDRLNDEPLLIWPFALAVQQTVDKLDVAQRGAVFQYATRFATTVKTPLEEALQILGNITTFLTIFPGPTAPVGVVADAVVQSASAAVSFMRQMDQDDAEAVSLFEKEADRLSQGGRYFDPLVQAAGAVAAAAAVPGALKSVLRFDKEITHLPVARTVGGKSAKGAEDAERYLAKGADNKAITGTSKADVFGPPSEVALAAGKKRPPQAKQVSPTGTAAKEKIDDIVIPPKATVEAETEKLAAQLKNLEGPGFQSPVYKDLNMTPEQKDVFARINGNPLAGRAPRVPTERLKPERAKQLLEAERASQEILDKLAKHWSNALPGRRGSKLTADQKAKALFNLLTKKPLTKGTVNSRVRELFYDQWRKRFNESIARDPDFIAALKKHAGIEFTPAGSGVTAFRVQALDTSGKSHWVDINWDHFIRHDDAVAAALNANNYKALVPTVDAANLAANLGLENQVLKEGIERYERMIRSNDPIPPRASSNSEFADYVDVFTDILDDG